MFSFPLHIASQGSVEFGEKIRTISISTNSLVDRRNMWGLVEQGQQNCFECIDNVAFQISHFPDMPDVRKMFQNKQSNKQAKNILSLLHKECATNIKLCRSPKY